MKCCLGSAIFLTKSLVSPILLFSSISLHCSFKKAFLSLHAILWNSAFSWVYLYLSPLPSLLSFPKLFVKPLQTTVLPSCISFSLGWFWSLSSVQCYKPPSIVLQGLCLPALIPWISSILHISPPGCSFISFIISFYIKLVNMSKQFSWVLWAVLVNLRREFWESPIYS